MNSVVLTGRITKALELRTTTSGKSVCNFDIAVNRIGEGADFINCQVWGAQAENLCKYQGKGSLIAISGTLTVDRYENDKGENRYKTYVLVRNIEFLSSKSTEQQSGPEKSNSEIVRDLMNDKDPFEEFGEEITLTDEDLPF